MPLCIEKVLDLLLLLMKMGAKAKVLCLYFVRRTKSVVEHVLVTYFLCKR